jgi:cobalt/nickel transport system ATP-binding protein
VTSDSGARPATDPVLDVVGLRPQPGRLALPPVGFQLAAVDRLVVRGPVGSGKTSLLWALLGFVPVAEGEVRWFGQACRHEADFQTWRGPVGLLFQDPDDQLLGPTVIEDLRFGPVNMGLDAQEAHRAALQQLQRLGLEQLADRAVWELSGGEQRLVALAGVLAMSPRALLLDEPTSGLDARTAQRVLEALLATGLPMVVATHDPRCVEALANRPTLDLGLGD